MPLLPSDKEEQELDERIRSKVQLEEKSEWENEYGKKDLSGFQMSSGRTGLKSKRFGSVETTVEYTWDDIRRMPIPVQLLARELVPLRILMRILSLWHPPDSNWVIRRGYHLVVGTFVLYPWIFYAFQIARQDDPGLERGLLEKI